MSGRIIRRACAALHRPSTSRDVRRHRRSLSVESLEPRNLLYNVSGQPWDHADISYSLVPDGTPWHPGSSVLFSEQSQSAPPEIWQREVARAFQTWANHADINFHRVEDGGQPLGRVDPEATLADIRIGSALSDYAAAYTVLPVAGTGGDVVLNAEHDFLHLDGQYAPRKTLTHEIGHALGLGHEYEQESVMGFQSHEYPETLTPDDIAGIQAIFGARKPDIYDAAANNDQISRATKLPVDLQRSLAVSADLTSHADVDYFQVTMPAERSQLTVSVDARSVSLLAPAVIIYDSEGNLLAENKADFGGVATAHANGLIPGANYFVAADGATTDEFGMGAYRLQIQFSGALTALPSAEIDVPLLQPTTVGGGLGVETHTVDGTATEAELLESPQPETSRTPQPTVLANSNGPCGCPACCAAATHEDTAVAPAVQDGQIHVETDLKPTVRLSRRQYLASGHRPPPAAVSVPVPAQIAVDSARQDHGIASAVEVAHASTHTVLATEAEFPDADAIDWQPANSDPLQLAAAPTPSVEARPISPQPESSLSVNRGSFEPLGLAHQTAPMTLSLLSDPLGSTVDDVTQPTTSPPFPTPVGLKTTAAISVYQDRLHDPARTGSAQALGVNYPVSQTPLLNLERFSRWFRRFRGN